MLQWYKKQKCGFIFDMDGVIINTCELHEESWKRLSQIYGFPWDMELNFKRDVFGTCSVDSASMLFKHHILNYDMKTICIKKDEIYQDLLKQHIHSNVVQGFLDFFKDVVDLGIPVALATSSPKEEAEFVLKSLGIYRQFNAVLNISMVKNAKPHPEIYIKASEALGIPPHSCIGFEDSVSGITALGRAGIPCVVVGTTLSYEKLQSTELDYQFYIRDFSEIAAGSAWGTLKNLNLSVSV